MESREKKIDVRNLKVSFRTNDGTVKAVRNIDFQLYKGETLAIVGESGSGKSVTAKAILGLLAPNRIIESGEIIYEGKDLLKLTEEEYNDYRGTKFSLIFQDPLSSLDPVIPIGKQLTEGMLVNGRANQRIARNDIKRMLKLISQNSDKNDSSKVNQCISEFKKFIKIGNKIEFKYNLAHQNILDVIDELDDISIDIITEEPKDIKETLLYVSKRLKNIFNQYTIDKNDNQITDLTSKLISQTKKYKNKDNSEALVKAINNINEYLKKISIKKKPNFFALGYCVYSKYDGYNKSDMDVMNKQMTEYMNKSFLDNFNTILQKAIKNSHDKSMKNKNEAIKIVEQNKNTFCEEKLNKRDCIKAAKNMIKAINTSIDKLELIKNDNAYTFHSSILNHIKMYYSGIRTNKKENKRIIKDGKKRDKLVAKGKESYSVIPPLIIDIDYHKNMLTQTVNVLLEDYKKAITANMNLNYVKLSNEYIEKLKERSSAIVYKVTKNMAKNKAVRLMKEVGIPEPRKRYKQFPFEFSGGMRQRIVIAIALSANPDILICDEPTTALDVTIQAQILELINKLKAERNLSVIFITHDLGVVANMADRIAVMYAGKIVENGTAEEIFYEPAHPYTWALLASMPDLETKNRLEAIPGTPPNMIIPPVGDAFATRNKYAMKIDLKQEPPMFEITPTHSAATWLLHPNAPKVEMPQVVKERIERMQKMEVLVDAE